MPGRLIALAPLVGLAVGAASWLVPAAASAPAASEATTYQRQAIGATNAQRRDHGRVTLQRRDCVQKFAVRQAKRMAAADEMFHQELGPILRSCGLDLAGENVAVGYPSGTSVVNAGWMRSPPHRHNILRRHYRVIGLGARQSHDGTWYASQVFGRKASR